MKKSAFTILAVVALIFIAAASFRPSLPLQAPKGIPDSVFAVFDKSCVTCHSTDGNGMAKSKLNFDNWDSYSSDKMASKASAIAKVLTKGTMPPSGFRKSNPGLAPTETDVNRVLSWAGTFNK